MSCCCGGYELVGEQCVERDIASHSVFCQHPGLPCRHLAVRAGMLRIGMRATPYLPGQRHECWQEARQAVQRRREVAQDGTLHVRDSKLMLTVCSSALAAPVGLMWLLSVPAGCRSSVRFRGTLACTKKTRSASTAATVALWRRAAKLKSTHLAKVIPAGTGDGMRHHRWLQHCARRLQKAAQERRKCGRRRPAAAARCGALLWRCGCLAPSLAL